MTNELEKQFFDTFGIEQEYEDGTCDMDDKCRYTDCNTCQRINKFNYPQITDRILLELICIYNVFVRMEFYSSYVKDLKIEVLENLIKEYKNRKQTGAFDENLKEKVQALFKEER